MTAKGPSGNGEILAIHPGALGDVILFAQLLAALRGACGGRVWLIAGSEKGRLLAGLGAVDEAVDFDALPMEEVFSAKPLVDCSLPSRLAGGKGRNDGAGGDAGGCDLLVSCLATGNAEAERRLSALCRSRRAVFLPVRPPDVWKRHLVDYWGRQVGLETIPPPRWSAPAAWRRLARKALADAGLEGERPCLLIHPGAGAREKCWPLERFAELARARTVPSPSPGRSRIPEESIPVFVLGPVELEWWGRRTVDALRGEFVTVLAPPLPVLAGLCAAAAAFVGNDSGPTHLAAALGRPTVALFGPSDPLHFAPRGRRVLVARAKRLSTLGADSVIDALEKV